MKICLLFVIVVFCSIESAEAADTFTCLDLKNGRLPGNATGAVVVPAGTNCTFEITTVAGNAVRFDITATSLSGNDSVTFIDAINTRIPINGTKQRHISTVGKTQIQIIGTSGRSVFFAAYDYIPISGFSQKSFNTGEPFQLSLSADSFYTITSVRNDSVVASVAKISTSAVDPVLQQIFVFDGDDIVNSKFIGRLSDITKNLVASSTNKMTLVNLFGTVSTNYVLANDASVIAKFNKYTVYRMSSEGNIRGNVTDYSTRGAAYTFICTDCDSFYIGSLLFDTLGFANIAYVQFVGMSPTHRLQPLINYDSMTFTAQQLPQIVPTKMFTMYNYMSGIIVGFSTMNTWKEKWQTPFIGRKGVMINPSLWNPANNPSFTYTIADPSSTFTYSLTPSTLNFTSNSDSLQVSLLDSAGSAKTKKTYSSGSANETFTQIGNGIKVQLTTGKDTNVLLKFEISEGNSAKRLMSWTTIIVLLYKLCL